MNKKISIPLAVVAILLALPLAYNMLRSLNKAALVHETAAPLVLVPGGPVGLIGTVVALSTSTVTIEGQPPGNTAPVRLEVLVDTQTSITKVGPPPAYATSSVPLSDLKMGMLLNVAAEAEAGGVRHAERIIIPPAPAR